MVTSGKKAIKMRKVEISVKIIKGRRVITRKTQKTRFCAGLSYGKRHFFQPLKTWKVVLPVVLTEISPKVDFDHILGFSLPKWLFTLQLSFLNRFLNHFLTCFRFLPRLKSFLTIFWVFVSKNRVFLNLNFIFELLSLFCIDKMIKFNPSFNIY